MARSDHPKGATLRAGKEGTTLFIPTDAPMGRAMRRYLERTTRLIESRALVQSKKGVGNE